MFFKFLLANYNPDEDDDYIAARKNGSIIIGHIQTTDNNNLLQVPQIIVDQPLGRGSSGILR